MLLKESEGRFLSSLLGACLSVVEKAGRAVQLITDTGLYRASRLAFLKLSLLFLFAA